MSNHFLAELKSQTGPLHEQLEARVDMLRRLNQRDLYGNLLSAFYGFYAPLEARLASVPGIESLGFDLAARRKAQWLEQDLLFLGIDAAGLPRASELPPLDSLSSVLGCCYVLEGATLGGQIIDRHLRQSLGIEPATGGAFFHSYGDQVGPMWNRFREVVTDFATSDERQRAIVQSAQATFRSFDDWLAQRLVALP